VQRLPASRLTTRRRIRAVGTLVYDDADIRKLQALVGRKRQVIDAAVDTCAGLPAQTRASWKLFALEVATYEQATPLADWTFTFRSFGLQGEAYSAQLDTWATEVRSARCSVPLVGEPDPLAPAAPPWVSAVKWGAAAAIVGGLVYAAVAYKPLVRLLASKRRAA
jgi:hypothetical protein